MGHALRIGHLAASVDGLARTPEATSRAASHVGGQEEATDGVVKWRS